MNINAPFILCPMPMPSQEYIVGPDMRNQRSPLYEAVRVNVILVLPTEVRKVVEFRKAVSGTSVELEGGSSLANKSWGELDAREKARSA